MTSGAPANEHPVVLELVDASKSYAGTPALRGVSFAVTSGKIHALVGENGAGKSTLVNILSGVIEPDAGEIRLDGTPVRFRAPLEANRRGIHLVHQELALLFESTVVENVFLGSEIARRGVLDWPAMRQQTASTLERLGVALAPDARLATLPVAHRQMVEIARSLIGDARVVILDEPTAALAPAEAERLFGVLRQFRAEGRAVVYISHRIGEVLEVADTVTVLKDGELVGSWPTTGLEQAELVRRMVGRPISDLFPARAGKMAPSAPMLELSNLVDPPRLAGVGIAMRPGEIVGLAGLEGQGQDEILACLAGERRPARGELRVDGSKVPWGNVRRMIACGVGFVPEDRKTKGLLLEHSAVRNIALPSLDLLSRFGWVRTNEEERLGRDAATAVGIRGAIGLAVQSLSGGNQQKVVLAKWLARRLKVLLLNQPTRGVDVGAKGEIYALLRAFAEQGGAALLMSRELVEILGLCDRVLVVRNGRVVAEFGRGASEEQVMAAATGGVAA